MNLGITPSLHYVRTYSTVLKQVVREVLPVNGQPEKHRWWLKPIKQQEEDIAMDKEKCDTCTCYECACDECTCECHEEAEATAKYNSLVNSTDYEGHWLNDSADVAEKGND
jgi:hypothetical protein